MYAFHVNPDLNLANILESVCKKAWHYCFFPQIFLLFLMGIYMTVYGYIRPYRSLCSNVIELVVSLNFLLLLILDSTSYFSDMYFIFQSASSNEHCYGQFEGVTIISWILMPFYYLPLVALCITALVLGGLYFRYVCVLYLFMSSVHTYAYTFS